MYDCIITSGCSFSSSVDTWAYKLGNKLHLPSYHFGQGSGGNDYIARTIIYGILSIKPVNPLVIVMWSGLNRKSFFITEEETRHYEHLSRSMSLRFNPNPVNFINKYTDNKPPTKTAWLFGHPGYSCLNPYVRKFSEDYHKSFHTVEGSVIESFEHFLRLQDFCKLRKITLVNLTWMNIFCDINDNYVEDYVNVKHLYDSIDFDNWIFWKEKDGLFEYVKDNKLSFLKDNIHPSFDSHTHFVDNFLIDKLKEKGVI